MLCIVYLTIIYIYRRHNVSLNFVAYVIIVYDVIRALVTKIARF